MKNDIQNNRGITLISLIITVVILIILSGVAIYLTIGKNGIYSRAKYAKEEYKKAQIKEKIEIAILDIQNDILEKNKENHFDMNDIIENLPIKLNTSELWINIEKEEPEGKYNGYNFYITKKYKVIIDNKEDSTENNECIISFYDNNKIKEIKVKNGETIQLEEISKEYYFFEGWSLSVNGEILKETEYLVKSNMNFYANWLVNGETIPEINDLKILLDCAKVTEQNINNINDLINNPELVEKLVKNENSLNYIFRSNEILENLESVEDLKKLLNEKIATVPAMNSNSSSEGNVLYSSYHEGRPYYAFDKNEQTYWRPSPDRNIADTYLAFKFLNTQRCYKINILFGYTRHDGEEFKYIFQGSNDGENWEDISEELTHNLEGSYTIFTKNLNKYSYFRFKGVSGASMHITGKYSITIKELEFYCIK